MREQLSASACLAASITLLYKLLSQDHNLVQPAMVIQNSSGEVVFKWEGTLPEPVEGHPWARPDPASVLLQAKAGSFNAETLRVVHASKFGQL